MEIYKPILENKNYQINSLGFIKNVKTGRILKGYLGTDGYIKIKLFDGHGNFKKYYIHDLIAKTFNLPNPDDKPFIKHLDGNFFNNSLTNLTYSNQCENKCFLKNNYSKYNFDDD